MTLYELTNEYLRLIDLLEDEDATEDAINDTMSMLLEDLDDKVENYGKVLKQLQADAEAVKQEKLRLARKQQAIENGVERIRKALLTAMLITGQKKIKTNLFTFSTTTRLKTILDVEEDAIPEEFARVTVKADMKKIDEYLKAGHEVPWAHQEQAQSLTVR